MHAARDVEAGVSIGLDQQQAAKESQGTPFLMPSLHRQCLPTDHCRWGQFRNTYLLGGHPALVVLFIYLLKQFKFLFSKELNCQLTQRGNSCTTQPSVSEVHT